MIVSSNRSRAEWKKLIEEIEAAEAGEVTESSEIRSAMRVTNTGRVSARMGSWSK